MANVDAAEPQRAGEEGSRIKLDHQLTAEGLLKQPVAAGSQFHRREPVETGVPLQIIKGNLGSKRSAESPFEDGAKLIAAEPSGEGKTPDKQAQNKNERDCPEKKPDESEKKSFACFSHGGILVEVLAVDNLSWTPTGSKTPLLEGFSFTLPRRHLAAVIGPSGCGKSSLLRILAGVEPVPSEAVVRFGEPTDQGAPQSSAVRIGYVPQFGIAYERLTVAETIQDAVRLRNRCGAAAGRRVALGLSETLGLEPIGENRVAVLSGGQRRRLALGMELAGNPEVLLCDEVTSGLDPRSEREISDLLRRLARKDGRLVVAVVHGMDHIHHFDSVLVMHAGRLVFHGPPAYLGHYFQVEHPAEIFPRLALRKPEGWSSSWQKHRAAYEVRIERFDALRTELEPAEASPAEELSEPPDPPTDDLPDHPHKAAEPGPPESAQGVELQGGGVPIDAGGIPGAAPAETSSTDSPPARTQAEDIHRPPGLVRQTILLFNRRWRLFFRDPGGIWLQLLLAAGFPAVVVLFALSGLPEIQRLNMGLEIGLLQQLREAYSYVVESTRAGSLVSGLVLLQVILLGLMASNNGAREMVADRLIFEKERLAGLSPAAHLLSRLAFLAVPVVVQSFWMAWFVDTICRFPGSLSGQIATLTLLNAAITVASLAISSLARTPEQASLLAVYLVGFQLPLSGILLSLPTLIGELVRPLISSYWAWSGLMQTMRETAHYDVVQRVSQTPFAPYLLCLWALLGHIAVGLAVARAGVEKTSWPRE